MTKKPLKKILILIMGTFSSLVLILCIHIYIVTRPKAPDAHTIVMARVDLKQSITIDDAAKITAWFYQQDGISHVLCNAAMDNVVFTFYPVKANGNDIVSRFKTGLGYANAVRYIPTEKEMQGGCPVAAASYTYKLYSFFRKAL